jgi:hypothetical protein
MGQTWETFRIRLHEYFGDYKYGNKPQFAQHLLNNKHSTDPMECIMDTLYTTNKGKMLNAKEIIYIY